MNNVNKTGKRLCKMCEKTWRAVEKNLSIINLVGKIEACTQFLLMFYGWFLGGFTLDYSLFGRVFWELYT